MLDHTPAQAMSRVDASPVATPSGVFDVAILGFGPVGAVLACLLARAGLSVAIVEQHPGIFDKPRAITIDHEALHALQLCGVGDDFEPLIEPHRGTDFLGIDGNPIRAFYPQTPPFPLSWDPNVVFIQPELEALLRKAVETLPEIRVWLSHKAETLESVDDRVRLTAQALDGGRPLTIEARYLIGCDGTNSFVRTTLGIELEDLHFDEWWIVVDAWQRSETKLPERCAQYCRPERPGTFIRGPRGLLRWEIKLLPGELPESFGEPENITRVLSRFVDPEAVEIWRSAVYRFNARVARRWRQGRILLAGDAAHQTPPFMGQGLCAGIRDAVNLAWKLRMVLRDGVNEDLLDTYEEERLPHVRTVVARTKEIGLVIGELDPARAQARDQRLRDELAEQKVVSRQSVIPPLSGGFLDERSTGTAGVLFVQPRVITKAGTKRLDDIVGPRFLLVLRGEAQRHWLDEAARARLDRIGALDVVVLSRGAPRAGDFTEDGTLVQDWLDSQRCDAALVRPDRFVFGTATTPDEARALVLAAESQLFGTT